MAKPANQGILSLVGATPLIELTRINLPFRVFAKLEGMNPGGSIKDRPALKMIQQALAEGRIGPGSVVIESTSGNLGIGLAQVCCYFGLRFICVVDPKTTPQHISIIKAYGGEIEMVDERDSATGEYLPNRLKRVQALQEKFSGSFWPNQYQNPHNPDAHYDTTISEIIEELGEAPDYLLAGVSTCGTIMGCARYIHDQKLKTKVIAVDVDGSIIFSEEKKPRFIPGMGASVKSHFLRVELLAEHVHVTDVECIQGCRRLLREEAILAGGSSGGVLMALEKIKAEITPESRCVLIFPDRGERYLNTIYSDEWVTQHFGEIQ